VSEVCNPSNERLVWEVQVKGYIERDNLLDAEALEMELKKVLKGLGVEVGVSEVIVVDAPRTHPR
jgi:hypothetical protein